MDVPNVRLKITEGTPSQSARVDEDGFIKLSEYDVQRIAKAVVQELSPTEASDGPPVAEGQEELFAVKSNAPDYRQGYVTRRQG